MISVKQSSYALAVEKTLHFKKAAELSNISQSALSTSLNELEKQRGLQIPINIEGKSDFYKVFSATS